MPWTLKFAIGSLVLFAVGAGIIAMACRATGWKAMDQLVWGLFIAGAGLLGCAVFSITCVVTNRKWRIVSLLLLIASVLLFLLLRLFAASA
jgi:hypothetical protein